MTEAKFATLQNTQKNSLAQSQADSARGILLALGAFAVVCLIAMMVSAGIEASGAHQTVSGYLWEDRDDSSDDDSLEVAGFKWEKLDTSEDITSETHIAGYLWEDRDDSSDDDSLEVAGFKWEKLDTSEDITSEVQLAGYVWENRDDKTTVTPA